MVGYLAELADANFKQLNVLLLGARRRIMAGWEGRRQGTSSQHPAPAVRQLPLSSRGIRSPHVPALALAQALAAHLPVVHVGCGGVPRRQERRGQEQHHQQPPRRAAGARAGVQAAGRRRNGGHLCQTGRSSSPCQSSVRSVGGRGHQGAPEREACAAVLFTWHLTRWLGARHQRREWAGRGEGPARLPRFCFPEDELFSGLTVE